MYNVCIIYIIYNYNIARKSEPVFPGKGQGKSAFVFGLGFCFFFPLYSDQVAEESFTVLGRNYGV